MKKNFIVLVSVSILLVVSSLIDNIRAESINDISEEMFYRDVITKQLNGSTINGGVDETIFRHYGAYSSRLEIINTGEHGFEYKITLPSGMNKKRILNPGQKIKIDFNYAYIGPNLMTDGVGLISIAGINGLDCKATITYTILKNNDSIGN